jgi:ADP-ribose pyrophosphatase
MTSTVDEQAYPVVATHERFTGHVFSIVTDDVRMPDGDVAARDYMRHVGAVAAVAIDDQDRIVLVRQYRHPVRAHLWELPAGLIDIPGEDLQHAAARELAEEVDLVAARWEHMLDAHTSPGCSNEKIRLFLARGLTEVAADARHHRSHEEAGMTWRYVPVDEAVAMVFAGDITNAAAVIGVLAAARLRDRDWNIPRA